MAFSFEPGALTAQGKSQSSTSIISMVKAKEKR